VIDTHAHVDRADAPELLARAREAGVDRVIAVGTSVANAREVLALADEHDGVFACLGIHPHEAGDVDDHDVDELRALLDHPKVVAVGETGLDYFRDYAPHDAQRALFDRQLAVARERASTVVIHTRAADTDTLGALSSFDGTVVMHCFSSPPLLEPAVERGYYVSFAGNVTYKNAYDIRAAARAVPRDRILAETDSPYLAPQPVRGRRNEPAHVVHTVDALAAARGEDAQELAAQIDANATAAFRLDT
jgi:TatD DNase family protein